MPCIILMTLKPFSFNGFPHLYSAKQLGRKELEDFFALASELEKMPAEKKNRLLEGKVLGTMFFEPSTRTRLSFESAALRLGMKALGFSDTKNISFAKGETISD